MTLMRRLSTPAFTPTEMGLALTEPDVGRMDYWGAVGAQSFEQSLLGMGLRDIPQLMPDVDTFIEESLEDYRAMQPPGAPLLPEDEAGMRDYFRRQADSVRDQFTSMSAEEWRASPSFREAIPYEEGMTAERAAALAQYSDDMAYYDWLRENHDADWFSTVGAVVTGLGAGAASPEAFVPILGPALRAAAAARLGIVGGRALTGAAEGAIGTAAVLPAIASREALIGREMTWEDMLLDVAIGAAAGSALGTIGGTLERRSIANRTALTARAEVAMTDARLTGEGAANVQIAINRIANNRQVDLPEPSRAAIDTALESLSLAERQRFVRARMDTAAQAAEMEIRRLDADEQGADLLRPETTVTALEEGAIRGETQVMRDRAREARTTERERRRASRPDRAEADRTIADDDVATRLREMGIAPAPKGARRRIRDLTPIERLALFDPDPRVRQLAEMEIDRRLAQDGTTAAPKRSKPGSISRETSRAAPSDPVLARTPDTGDAAADIDARTVAQEIAAEQGIAEDGTFAELADWERMDAEGSLTTAERATFAEAEAAVAKAANAEAVYEVAAACLLRAAA